MKTSAIKPGSDGSGPREKIAFIQGASRGIGLALITALLAEKAYGSVFASCRRPDEASGLNAIASSSDRLEILQLDVLDQASIAASAGTVMRAAGRLDLLVNCAGVLHGEGQLWPEKRLADVDPDAMDVSFRVNALGPLLVARGFEPALKASSDARFAALSARVGSIADNRSGGWYAYRASKAALNMMIRTLAVEWMRLPRPIGCFALHPGTVATGLSAPFSQNLSTKQVFNTDEAAAKLLYVLHSLSAEHSGGFFAYDGSRIEW